MLDSPAGRSNWQGEKPKPDYSRRPRLPSCGALLRSKAFRVCLLFVLFFLTTATLFFLTLRSWNAEPEYDVEKATKEYHKYLASPQHRALLYPTEDDRAQGNAAIIALVRNNELNEMSQSMRELEETFNRKFKYPWIFFNDEPFTNKFKRITTSLTDAETHYGTTYLPRRSC